MERIIEDGKVVASASFAILLDYAQLLNTLITLGISICTFIYVAKRARQVLTEPRRKGRRYAKK